jgi:hypothetical protein
MNTNNLASLLVGTVIAIKGWILGIAMRRRARKALDRELTNTELTSLTTWMNVEDAEDRRRGGKIS